MFREDGRKKDEIKQIIIKNLNSYTYLKQGNTHVRVKSDGPKEGNKLNISMVFSKSSRQEQINEKRIFELETEIYNIFNNIILTDNNIDIEIEVIQEDGSLISTIVNCVTLNLCYIGVPLIDFPCSITYSRFQDLTLCEEQGRNFFINVVWLMNREKIVYFKSLGRVTQEVLQKINEEGFLGCKKIYQQLKSFLISI
ncbi:exosome complex exonuclease rrp41 [Vairimorpha apis BRL 01]|uniref:Exosome complex exonuclease rrp41 n=1 Tax=Vairimorpha apis BRL 01 TaxID=1037528 RepID=T0L706_9MICR|nr:exosome complex exonuclease rrp41 [Vairimorpha apis BRL 01]